MDEESIARFWNKVEKTEACWLWRGGVNWDGYGQLWFMGACRRANRVSWLIEYGAYPAPGLHVLHRCDNPACVRPDHLFLGTHAENMLDMARKGRSHQRKLTEDQVREIRRRLSAGETTKRVAVDFGISRESARDIGLRRKWAWLD